ncbi:hypothetical protein Ancab_028973 [Ancistrocladus abbreviatus]
MGAAAEDDQMQWQTQGSSAHEEKILVSVRLRPLNGKEIASNDFSDWECINNTTILFKNCLGERSMYPNAYTFDRVFGSDCSTKQVYDEAAKEVALSVINGINATVFAYGQTSSGKTYTMGGITQYTIADLYDYMESQQKEREFALKFSAMEIYNEHVRDLLSADTTPLRLLDDPERGTVVEKLTEETLTDRSHLLELLAVCEAQRQVGETALNETSSRSHQILRLTVESSARQLVGARNSSTLAASVNFVDLAGSERASQTLSGGARLKEGCHINRSLLTLGKVIRNLSKGRNGHVPYRDSKLTRILQNSLGGNSRTAIICTMSPAHSHLEQSRNTLLFATCAKEVTTNAQVNVVMSDKALVKQLRKELARLEGELKNMSKASAHGDSAAILREKELQIEMMDKEIKEVSWQRDIAQSQIKELLVSAEQRNASRLQDKSRKSSAHRLKISMLDDSSVMSDMSDYQRIDVDLKTSEPLSLGDPQLNNQQMELLDKFETHFLSGESSPQLVSRTMEFVGPDPYQSWNKFVQSTDEDVEDNWKEVRCIEVQASCKHRKTRSDAMTIPLEENKEKQTAEEEEDDLSIMVRDEYPILSLNKAEMGLSHSPPDSDALVKRIRELQKTIDSLVNRYPGEHSPCSTESDISSSRGFNLGRSRSCRAILTAIPSLSGFEKAGQDMDMALDGLEELSGRLRSLRRHSDLNDINCVQSSKTELPTSIRTALMNEMEKDSKHSDGSDHSSDQTPDTVSNEIPKSVPEKQRGDMGDNAGMEVKATEPKDNISMDSVIDDLSDGMVAAQQLDRPQEFELQDNMLVKRLGDDAMDVMQCDVKSPSSWPEEFERQRRLIIEHWHACYTSLVHRTYFFLLFEGDPSDAIYMEVELRRLSFIKSKFAQGGKLMMDGQILTPASSKKALNQEREMLIKQLNKKFSAKEREVLFQKWGITLDSKKRRRQLVNRLWTDPSAMENTKESANLVGKLVGFTDEDQVPKEMFVGPNFTPRAINRRAYSWKM